MSFNAAIKKYTVIRITIFLIFGILIASNVDFSSLLAKFLLLISILFTLAAYLYKPLSASFKYRWAHGLLTSAMFLFLGIVLTQNKQSYQSVLPDKKQTFIVGYLAENPVEKLKSYKAEIIVISNRDSVNWFNANERMVVYFQKTDKIPLLFYGDLLVLSGEPNQIKNSGNPFGFNYNKYLKTKGIYRQMYADTSHWQLIEKAYRKDIFYYSIIMREKLLSVFKAANITDREYAILSALTLGYTEQLDVETKRAFAASGAAHILAVSGSHVAIILVVINLLLKKLDYNRKTRIVKSAIIIVFIWIFALITGLTPSVNRAAVMFTIVAIGQIFQRKTYMMNTLFLSIFVLLISNPLYIFDVGFQLSYAAVLAIVLIYPEIKDYFVFKNKVATYFGDVIAISLAAQIGTFPLSMYYFYQFTNYFILTNLAVVPLSYILVIGAIVFFVLSFITPILSYLGLVIKYLTQVLVFIVTYIENMPYSVTTGISVNILQVLLIYVVIGFVFIGYQQKVMKHYVMALGVLFAVLFLNTMRKYNFSDKNYFIVYNIKNSTALQFASLQSNTVVADSALIAENIRLENSLKPLSAHIATATPIIMELNKTEVPPDNYISSQSGFYYFNNKIFYVLSDRDILGQKAENKFKVDYLVITNNVQVHIKDLLQLFEPGIIIADASNTDSNCRLWKQQCSQINKSFHWVSESGAFFTSL